jgi:predicted  nucleic acid-binding Zn-ribbon protein
MSRWDPLLDLQAHDTTIDQLHHRRAHLPAQAELEEAMAALAKVEASAADVTERRHGLGRTQQRLEDEISSLNDRATQHDKTLYSGTIGNPRELQSLQDEITAIKRRISQLEDQELEVMEEIEPLDTELAAAARSQAELDGRATELRAQIAEAEVDIEGELDRVGTERSSIAAAVEAELLAEYDTLRSQLGGIAVAPLLGTSCGGCHLMLSAVEIDRIKKLPSDASVHCEECGRLLAR